MKSLWDELHKVRLLIFVENPNGGYFEQLQLNKEQFLAVSKFIANQFPITPLPNGDQDICLSVNDSVQIPTDTFIGLDNYYNEQSNDQA